MSGYVYAIGIEGSTLIKIGHSKSPNKRLASMQTGLPFKLEIVYQLRVEDPRRIELTLHRMLAEQQTRGEWFEMPKIALPELFATAVEKPAALGLEPKSKGGFDSSALGEWLYLARIEQRLTLKQVEAKSGLTNSLISNIEKGKRPMVAFQTIYRLARALGISHLSLDELVQEVTLKDWTRKQRIIGG